MALDSKYILMQDLFEVLTDKDTGLVLAGGKLKFFKDNARNVPKSVFKISGAPGFYTYVDVGNEITLNAAGYPDDAIYYYPYDESGDNIELYFIQVFSSGNIPQPTREAWPNAFASNVEEQSITTNLVPNGQFLLHNNLPETDVYQAGEIRAPETAIAPGGWYFVRDTDNSTDIVTFERYDEYDNEPPANPRYAININVEIPDVAQTVKDLRLRYDNVNRFSSDTQGYTYSFWGKCDSGTVECEIFLIKNFGTGGSPSTEVLVGTKILTTVDQQFYVNILFGDNADKTIGPDDDDYLDIAIRVPTASASKTTFSDIFIDEGTFTVENPAAFPQTTNTQFQYRSLAPKRPNYNGYDLYLPLILTPTGVDYDHSQIGKVYATIEDTLNIGELSCLDNTQKYEYLDYSDDGIPYARLGDKLWDNTNKVYKFGTGTDYFTAVYTGSGASFWVTNNANGSVTVPTDGTLATGFTFGTIHTGSNYYCKSYKISNTDFHIENINAGAVSTINAHTSTFTVGVVQTGTATLPQINYVLPTAATGLAGLYFTFHTYNSGDQGWYVWFKVNGSGSDPAPGGATGILVNLVGTDTASIVAEKIREALNGWQNTLITTVAASSIPAGAYFNIHSTAHTFFVWYEIDGAGSPPSIPGAIGIKVVITGDMTAAQVAAATQEAINRKYYAAPYLAGAFLRGVNNSSGNDPDASTRWSLVPGIIGDTIGTLQNSANLSHFHNIQTYLGTSGILAGITSSNAASTPQVSYPSDYDGGAESRPYNVYVNYVIKY